MCIRDRLAIEADLTSPMDGVWVAGTVAVEEDGVGEPAVAVVAVATAVLAVDPASSMAWVTVVAVSYTHLDVYKRQTVTLVRVVLPVLVTS